MSSTLSNQITNKNAATMALTSQLVAGGVLREAVATLETATADDSGHYYRMMLVHSSWRVSTLEIAHDAVTGLSDVDIGLYDLGDEDDPGDAVDADFFADAVDISSAGAMTDVTYERAATAIADIEAPLWEQLGLSEDPGKYYELVITAQADPNAAVTISARLRYVSPSA